MRVGPLLPVLAVAIALAAVVQAVPSAHPSAAGLEPRSAPGALVSSRGSDPAPHVASERVAAKAPTPPRTTDLGRIAGPRRAVGSPGVASDGAAASVRAIGRSVAPAASTSSLYQSSPAPMGVSDFGVGNGGAYTYGTSSFEGQLVLTSFAAFTATNITNTTQPAPDWALLQLDAVAVNVSLPPETPVRDNGTFWVQSELHFNGTSVLLQDLVSNYSVNTSEALPPSTLQGVHGTILDDELYVGLGPAFSVTAPSPSHPLTIELFDNISSSSGHTVLTFGYLVGGHGGTYDTVTFNGTASAGSPSQFLVDGSQLAPQGLLYDSEFVLGGNGAGSNANFVALNGSATLERYASGYSPVPSAFDFGQNVAETALGVAVTYIGSTAQFTAGPSFLYGLWHTGGSVANRTAAPASAGAITVKITMNPSYALAFATTATLASGPVSKANYSYAPSNVTGVLTTELPPASVPYVFTAWANGYESRNVTVGANGSYTLSLNASKSTIDAPVYLMGTAQATAYGQVGVAGTGYSASKKTLWLNASKDDLAPPFLRTNSLDYPSFTLFAASDVNLTIDVNGFVQSPEAYNYTDEAGAVTELANWTQGYFFYYGTGQDSVQNTTLQGGPQGGHTVVPIPPPSTVLFYHLSGATVANLNVESDAVGVLFYDASSGSATGLHIEGGAVGVLAFNSSHLTVTRSTSSGLDPTVLFPSLLADLFGSTSVDATDLSVASAGAGLASQGGSDLTVSELTVASGGLGLEVNNTSSSTVSDLAVEGGIAAAGNWTNSTDVAFSSVTVNGTGLVLTNDSGVTVFDGSATGYGSAVVASYNNSADGTFVHLAATLGATAANLSFCSDVNASSISASGNSVGAYVANAADVSGTGYASSGLSFGLYLDNTTLGTSTFTSLTATDQSIAALVTDSSTVRLASVVASNETLGLSAYLVVGFQVFPLAAVALLNDTAVNVTGVSASSYPFAVWSTNSSTVNVSQVTSWYGVEAVAFNWTNSSTVTNVFAFSDLLGVSVRNCTDTTVATSTLEVSAQVGVELNNGTGDVIENDNFVGNNGSAVNGSFNASRLQAWSNNSTDPTFRDDFWTDHSGSGAYVVNVTGKTRDETPRGSFYPEGLEFVELGLGPGSNWSVILASQNYSVNVSLFYVPGWALAHGPLVFSVPEANGLTPHPANGTLTWSGAAESQTIIFGSPPSSSASNPFSLLLVIELVAVAAVVAVAALLLLRRRRRPPRAAPAPTAPPPSQAGEWPPDGQR